MFGGGCTHNGAPRMYSALRLSFSVRPKISLVVSSFGDSHALSRAQHTHFSFHLFLSWHTLLAVQVGSRINNILKWASVVENYASRMKLVDMMVLGIPRTVVSYLWLHCRYQWYEVVFLTTATTFDRLYFCVGGEVFPVWTKPWILCFHHILQYQYGARCEKNMELADLSITSACLLQDHKYHHSKQDCRKTVSQNSTILPRHTLG